MKKLMMIVVLMSASVYADQVCKEVVNCQDVRNKLTKEERKCFLPKTRVVTKVITKVVTKTVFVEKPVVVEKERVVNHYYIIDDRRKNSLSLLGLATPSGLGSSTVNTTIKAETYYRPDLGLMYQRDFNEDIRGTIGASFRGNVMLGLGYNF